MSVEQEQESAAQEAAEESSEFEQAFAEFASSSQEEVIDSQDDEPEQSDPQPEPVAEESDFEKLKRELEETRKAAQDYEHRFKSEVGRQAAYQRQIQELKTQIQAAPNQTQAQQRQLSTQMSKLVDDYPEIAEALSSEISTAIQATKDEISSQLKPIYEERQRIAYEAEEAAVKAAYPNLQEIASSAEFATWFSQQPESVRSLANSRNPSDAIAVLDYFTGGARFNAAQSVGNPQVQKIKEQRQATLQRNQSVKNTAPPPVGDGADDFNSAFEFYANKARRR